MGRARPTNDAAGLRGSSVGRDRPRDGMRSTQLRDLQTAANLDEEDVHMLSCMLKAFCTSRISETGQARCTSDTAELHVSNVGQAVHTTVCGAPQGALPLGTASLVQVLRTPAAPTADHGRHSAFPRVLRELIRCRAHRTQVHHRGVRQGKLAEDDPTSREFFATGTNSMCQNLYVLAAEITVSNCKK